MLQITRYKREGINAGGIETDLFTDMPNSYWGENLSFLSKKNFYCRSLLILKIPFFFFNRIIIFYRQLYL